MSSRRGQVLIDTKWRGKREGKARLVPLFPRIWLEICLEDSLKQREREREGEGKERKADILKKRHPKEKVVEKAVILLNCKTKYSTKQDKNSHDTHSKEEAGTATRQPARSCENCPSIRVP
jgi:hypothetical protein